MAEVVGFVGFAAQLLGGTGRILELCGTLKKAPEDAKKLMKSVKQLDNLIIAAQKRHEDGILSADANLAVERCEKLINDTEKNVERLLRKRSGFSEKCKELTRRLKSKQEFAELDKKLLQEVGRLQLALDNDES